MSARRGLQFGSSREGGVNGGKASCMLGRRCEEWESVIDVGTAG